MNLSTVFAKMAMLILIMLLGYLCARIGITGPEFNKRVTPLMVTVLLPAIYLMGNPVQNVGRCLGTAEVNAKYYPHIIAVCAINALLSIWVMQSIV